MGSFGGHALPGSFFIVYAFFLTTCAYVKFLQSSKGDTRFKSFASFYFPYGKLQRFPLEGLLKVLLTTIALSIEIYTGFNNGKFVAMGNAQHATMFAYFGFNGVIDLLQHFKAPLPRDTEYVTLAMAFMVEGLLFKFHLHGRSQLDVLVHTLLLYVVYACIISVIVEMKYRHSILSPLARAYFSLIQGTWFWQVGFILYNPSPNAVPWKADDHGELTLVTLLFAWHALADFIILLVTTVTIHVCCRRRNGIAENDVGLKRLLHSGSNGQAVVCVQSDSDSDLEFEQPAVGVNR
ncbi:transmembrane protein 45B-like [Liolophura sinensis]|uniref:transmembrane protein 45B-like n=1 Tax=Liolophura sinensis TaxID=3198878 RepID=UPI003158379D